MRTSEMLQRAREMIGTAGHDSDSHHRQKTNWKAKSRAKEKKKQQQTKGDMMRQPGRPVTENNRKWMERERGARLQEREQEKTSLHIRMEVQEKEEGKRNNVA